MTSGRWAVVSHDEYRSELLAGKRPVQLAIANLPGVATPLVTYSVWLETETETYFEEH